MKCNLYLPYIDYNNINFDVDNSYYKDNDYQKALENDYIKNNDIISNSINDYFEGNTSFLRQDNNLGNTINFFGVKPSKNEEKVSYSSCNGEVHCENYSLNVIETIKSNIISNEMMILCLKLDYDTMDEEFESDFKMWCSSHDKINSTNMNDEWKFKNEPKRDLILEINNFKVELKNVMILELSYDNIIIMVEKIREII